MDYWVTYIAGRPRLGGDRNTLANRPRRAILMCDGKMRLLRGRSMGVGEEMFNTYRDEFKKLAEAKYIRVQVGGAQGPEYDFSESAPIPMPSTPVVAAPPPPPPPPPPAAEVKEEEPEDKPLDRMNKTELVAFLAEKSGLPEEELSGFTKRQLLEQAPELLAESEEPV